MSAAYLNSIKFLFFLSFFISGVLESCRLKLDFMEQHKGADVHTALSASVSLLSSLLTKQLHESSIFQEHYWSLSSPPPPHTHTQYTLLKSSNHLPLSPAVSSWHKCDGHRLVRQERQPAAHVEASGGIQGSCLPNNAKRSRWGPLYLLLSRSLSALVQWSRYINLVFA